ncbi:MAG: coenzyme F420-0:L-glutamate ligase, partial [Bacteroidales bacterium]|nr:coenzyme F420-0:L-glutamate ligase [Bacteroidales bacterium]
IERTIAAEKEKVTATDFKAEGTTPRMVKSLVASLADLVSGSGQRGTPLVVVKNYLLNYKG